MNEERVIEEEITATERCIRKAEEMKEKYADVINELATKYGKDLGVGFEMLKAIARAKIYGEEPLYAADIEFNLDELVQDEKELLVFSEEALKDKGIQW